MTALLVGGVVSMIVALASTPLLIRVLRARGIGQPIHEDVTQHAAKAGTPTMGGVMITISALVGYSAARLVLGAGPTADGSRVLLALTGGAIVGITDDWLKVRRGRNLGLRRVQKSLMEAAVIALFCVLDLSRVAPCTAISVTRCQGPGVDLGPVVWTVFAVAVFWVTTNAVNFTDGLEGQLSGSAAITFAALTGIAFWQFRHLGLYRITNALDLAIVAGCLTAACAGFLWWNCQPKTIFMGDAGSLAIGTSMAALALSMNVSLLIPVFGALYVIEGGSTALQIYTYKWYFKRHAGTRRLFRMAPIHHHFELAGWPESTIVVRFWIISALAAAAAVAIFYADALRNIH